MIRNYSIISPSLDGVLSHESIQYDGLRRPQEIIRALDGPNKDDILNDPSNRKVLQGYFYDLYGLFMKKLSQFVVEVEYPESEQLKLQALLQELIKIKRIVESNDNSKIIN